MRLKKYKNLPNCIPVRIPYVNHIHEILELLSEIQPHKDPEKLLDGIIESLKMIRDKK